MSKLFTKRFANDTTRQFYGDYGYLYETGNYVGRQYTVANAAQQTGKKSKKRRLEKIAVGEVEVDVW